MKKMKGFAVAAPVMEYSPYGLYEGQRARFKYQSDMEDFEDLHRETESMRKKLQTMKERRSILLAEVKFLKRRQKFLMQNRSSNTPVERHFLQQQNMLIKSKSNVKKQQKVFSGKEEPTLQSSLSFLNLNQKERLNSGKEATARSMKPIFDLNQISIEEEELQAQTNWVRTDGFKKSSIRNGSDEQAQHNDVTVSACRNTGNGTNRTGKRKISWQDQVALRV